jgi:hypothetical protein
MRVDGWQRNTDAHGRDCIYNTEDVFSNSNNNIKNYCLAHSVTVHDEVMRSFYQHGITLNRHEKWCGDKKDGQVAPTVYLLICHHEVRCSNAESNRLTGS